MAGKKQPIRYIRLIFIGLLWTLVYLQVTSVGLFFVFNFNPLILTDWSDKASDFLNSRWVINTPYDFGLLLCMILFVPAWIIGWRILYRFRWKRLIPSKLLEKKVKHQSIKVASSKKGFTPHKLRVQSSALLSVAPKLPSTPSSGPSTGSRGGVSGTGLDNTIDDDVLDMPIIDAAEEMSIQKVLPLTANISADFFPHISLGGFRASFALSTDSRAIVVQVIDKPDSTWVADVDTPILKSDWYCESHILKTPVKDVIKVSEILRESEPDSSAIPVILLMSGNLINAEETTTYLEKHNVMLLRLEDADAESIPLFTEFLSEYFGNKIPDLNTTATGSV